MIEDAQFRSRVAAHKAIVARLSDSVKSAYLKGKLKEAWNTFSDAEKIPSTIEDAETIFKVGLLQLQSVQEIVATDGVNAEAATDLPPNA
jgi:hypothetical protein